MRQTQRILIIDDSKEIVTALKAFFERKYEVITASDGIEGLLALEQNKNSIDLVISDLLMPELDGLRVISHLKKVSWCSCHRNHWLEREYRSSWAKIVCRSDF